MLGRFLRKVFVFQQLAQPVEHFHHALLALAAQILRPLHFALRDLILQPLAQL
jgi:hypothetical protein